MSVLYPVLILVLLQRAAELVLAAANTRRLRAIGGVEVDARGYRWFIALHAAWLTSLFVLVPANAAPFWSLLGLYAALQLGRIWVIASLGRRWTTRIILLPGAPLVRSGPYAGCGTRITPLSQWKSRCCRSPSARSRSRLCSPPPTLC